MPLPLVELSERELAQIISRRVRAIKGVKDCRQVRVRMAGKSPYVHLHIWLDVKLGYERTHGVAADVEREVRNTIPNARVTIRTEPLGEDREAVWRLVKEIAEGEPGSRGAHNIHIQKLNGTLGVDFHLELSANMTVKEAHQVSDRIERKLKVANPSISEVIIHEESVSDLLFSELTGTGTEVRWYIQHVVERFPEMKIVHKPIIRRMRDQLHVVLRCTFDPGISIEKAHEITGKLEVAIKSGRSDIARIDVHEEPAKA